MDDTRVAGICATIGEFEKLKLQMVPKQLKRGNIMQLCQMTVVGLNFFSPALNPCSGTNIQSYSRSLCTLSDYTMTGYGQSFPGKRRWHVSQSMSLHKINK